MTDQSSQSPADVITDHLTQCTDAQAALVVEGNADQIVADLIAAGWTLEERVDEVAGKRIRFMKIPDSLATSDATPQ